MIDDHGAVTALREAPGLVAPLVGLRVGFLHTGAEGFHEFVGVALRRAGLAVRTHEHVTVVLAHRRSFGAAQLNLSYRMSAGASLASRSSRRKLASTIGGGPATQARTSAHRPLLSSPAPARAQTHPKRHPPHATPRPPRPPPSARA